MKKKNGLLSSKNFAKPIGFINEHKGILIVMALLVLIRLVALYELGIEYGLQSDDLSYVRSGIHFANTGVITMHDTYPSAQIMPGMTYLIGLLSLIFGEGKLLWLVLKLLWIGMGTLSAWYIYRSVSLFAPRWCGVVASLALFRPDYVWMDNVILTETPFILALVAMVYYTLKMGKEKQSKRSFWLCLVFYMIALLLKANIAPYPVFALIYLLIVKYDRKLLFKQCIILACAVLCFVIPWSVRNYVHFNAFVPLTYGAGNPTLLGTYQGRGYPSDESLDYKTNVSDVTREEYADYYDEDGNIKPEFARYVSLQNDAIRASYRQKVWLKNDPKGFLYSLLIYKPQSMINSIFQWRSILGIKVDLLSRLPYVEMILCILVTAAAIALKKFRGPILYAMAVYIGNIYIYATTFSFDRYNASLVYLRYIIIGIGISLFIRIIATSLDSLKKEDKAERSEKPKKAKNH
ncbi:MAG: glycosyltransferase family 39 protein [Clostridia bacterium]|nr:glycosyltransferase family 39 protein [Clostridia bacterium]